MNTTLIIILVVTIIIIFFKFIKPLLMKKESMSENHVYNVAYDLGLNYLKISSNHNFYNIPYPAVMFDIDDTLIDNSGKPIKPIINLLKKCIKYDLLVIIITARDSMYSNETIQELKKHNIKYTMLYLKEPQDNIYDFKSKIKQNLKEYDNIVTIMSIGDNIVDVDGDYSGYFIKLPNKNDDKLYHLNSDKKLEVIDITK